MRLLVQKVSAGSCTDTSFKTLRRGAASFDENFAGRYMEKFGSKRRAFWKFIFRIGVIRFYFVRMLIKRCIYTGSCWFFDQAQEQRRKMRDKMFETF